MNKTIEERVRDGATFLDMTVPGWMDKINLEALRLSSCRYCVIGQIFGEYSKLYDLFPEFMPKCKADAHVVIWTNPSFDHGFSDRDGIDLLGEHYYQFLTAAWRKLILDRRAAQLAADPELASLGAALAMLPKGARQ